ncbi:DDE family transposase [Cohnella phaseoli]|uniref:DDE family transposase n=2 Tax=Cohnella phaseoli TaxID=456490 RepID=A0A3D9JS72_9BACL|nr:DDE family transposase [Cohnella phaseoli]
MELPNTKETQKEYGYTTTYKVGFRIARALSSHLYDVENKLAISTCLSRYDDNERDLAKRNIEHMLQLRSAPVRDLILFDRGYPSADFMLYLQEKGISYLMRAQGSFYKEIVNTTRPDEVVTIEITKARAKELKKQGKSLAPGTVLQVRVIKVELSTGETEILLTNVSADELSYEASKPLYFKRWGVETRFDDLKHKFEIENFSGQKPQLIEQDFYATVLLSNMASVMEQEAEEQLQETKRTDHLKYTEYRINKNILVGKLRNRLIAMVLEDDDGKRDEMHERFLEELQRNIVPVVKDRTFKRDKQTKANKFTKTKRRGL